MLGAGVPAVEFAGSAVGVQTLLGAWTILKGCGPGRIGLVRRAWSCLSGRGKRDEKTEQPKLLLTGDDGVVASIEMPGEEERRRLDAPTLPLPSCESPRGGFVLGERLPFEAPAKALNRPVAALDSAA